MPPDSPQMRFAHDERVYKAFLEILNMYRKGQKTINQVYEEVQSRSPTIQVQHKVSAQDSRCCGHQGLYAASRLVLARLVLGSFLSVRYAAHIWMWSGHTCDDGRRWRCYSKHTRICSPSSRTSCLTIPLRSGLRHGCASTLILCSRYHMRSS